MDVVPVRPEHAEQLRAIYLAQVAHAPHSSLLPNPARFRDELMGSREKSLHPTWKPKESHVLVAETSGAAHGFAALVKYDDHRGTEHQAISGLFFANEAAGDALIRACESQATADELNAFPSVHGNTLIQTYNAGWDGLSDRIPNVARLLVKHGYAPYVRELHLTAQLQQSQSKTAQLPQGISLNVPDEPEGNLGARLIQVMDGETEIGVCSYSSLTLLTDDPMAKRTGYIWWLYVDEAYRRRGLARALMLAAREQLVMQGCTDWWLTTSVDNWPAQSLYYELGFDVVDCSVSFRKSRSA